MLQHVGGKHLHTAFACIDYTVFLQISFLHPPSSLYLEDEAVRGGGDFGGEDSDTVSPQSSSPTHLYFKI
jgi:hypothetical protein